MTPRTTRLGSFLFLIAAAGLSAVGRGDEAPSAPRIRIRLDPGHPWRPPFGLDRVGRPLAVVVEAEGRPAGSEYALEASLDGKEAGRYPFRFPANPPYAARVTLDGIADELALSARAGSAGERRVLARQSIHPPAVEAEAIARPDTAINPVDLGTILVPSDWLLLGPGQAGVVDVAACRRSGDVPDARVRAWFESAPTRVESATIPLRGGRVARRHLRLPAAPTGRDRDAVHISLTDGQGRSLWQKTIPAMLVQAPPRWPSFGATATRLRFDAPISVRDPKTGKYSSLKYEEGWDPALRDVVVSLPNGSRFVFWRGSSYIPFWAGRHNTGACYEWAEILSRFPDAVDCVEPLMDKELRYGRVEVVESTPARVHVRWTYQSTDLHYKVWGDSAVEDYYFYPDGFGTRVLTLRSDPAFDYELSEFIVLTPQGAYPFDVLPSPLVDALLADGRTCTFPFPDLGGAPPCDPRGQPAVYRLRLHRDDSLAAVYFNPNETQLPPVRFGPFYDRGVMVTPCYWGSHWPLARGNATGSAIDDRIRLSPCHNSVMSWAKCKPVPLRTAHLNSVDTLGRSKPMIVRQWAWLIGMTDAPARRLLDRALSFAKPPSLKLQGARLDADSYAPERRGLRLRVEGRSVSIRVEPDRPCVDPVFELLDAPPGPIAVTLSGRPLDPGRFAWDGRTLWLDATIGRPTELRIAFAGPPRR